MVCPGLVELALLLQVLDLVFGLFLSDTHIVGSLEDDIDRSNFIVFLSDIANHRKD
nr:hypothetical protein [Halomicroarcula marina]